MSLKRTATPKGVRAVAGKAVKPRCAVTDRRSGYDRGPRHGQGRYSSCVRPVSLTTGSGSSSATMAAVGLPSSPARMTNTP